jgi:hypothetical protein
VLYIEENEIKASEYIEENGYIKASDYIKASEGLITSPPRGFPPWGLYPLGS